MVNLNIALPNGVNAIPITTSTGFSIDIDKQILKVHMEMEGTKNHQTILKRKNNMEDTLAGIKTYYRTIIIKTV